MIDPIFNILPSILFYDRLQVLLWLVLKRGATGIFLNISVITYPSISFSFIGDPQNGTDVAKLCI